MVKSNLQLNPLVTPHHEDYPSPVPAMSLPSSTAAHHTLLPPVPLCEQEKFIKGEYIDFSTLNTKAIFSTPEHTVYVTKLFYPRAYFPL